MIYLWKEQTDNRRSQYNTCNNFTNNSRLPYLFK